MGFEEDLAAMAGVPHESSEEEETDEETVDEVEDSEKEPEEVVDETEEEEETSDDEEESEEETVTVSEREQALLARLEEQQARLDALEARSQDDSSEKDKETSQEVDPNFLEGVEDIDDILADKDKFNKLLVAVYKRGVEDSSNRSAENILSSLPKVITTAVSQQVTMREMVNQFYEENPDLQGVKRQVGAVANEIASNEPGLTIPEIFDKAAKLTRERLKLKELPKKKEMPKKKPTFVKQSSRRVPDTEELSGVAAEIAAMEDL